jgi:anti-anti-sigma factor
MQEPILKPAGRLDSDAAPEFEREVLTSLDSDAAWLLLDLADLVYICSAGLRIVLMAAKRLRGSGRGFGLCGLQPPVAEVFAISGLTAILPIYLDRESALAALL